MSQGQSRPAVLLGTPAAGEQVSMHYTRSLLAVQRRFGELGWRLDVSARAHGLVTTSRNAFASAVVENPDLTHLLMVDADISFEPEVIERLVTADFDISGACVPLRQVSWGRVASLLSQRPDATATELADVSHEYAVAFTPGAGAELRTDGFLKARFLGSALMLISRAALVALSQSDQVQRYAGGASLGAGSPEHGWTFFDPLVDPHSGFYLSEDYAFCHRWTQLGGTIHADTRSTITHTGPISIVGNFADTIKAVSGP